MKLFFILLFLHWCSGQDYGGLSLSLGNGPIKIGRWQVLSEKFCAIIAQDPKFYAEIFQEIQINFWQFCAYVLRGQMGCRAGNGGKLNNS